jgi:hypothetical protein
VSLGSLLLFVSLPASVGSAVGTADEVHYTLTGPTSVAFDWRGTATDIRYGPTTSYGSTATASTPTPLPFSSAGPFQEAELTGLTPGATYHYSIGEGPDQTFVTAPTGAFRFDVEGDIGDSGSYANVTPTQGQIAADQPAFVLGVGDLTYGNDHGQAAVDGHFNDVMVWSRQAAYMPAWGNHEWDSSSDDLRNYKGRFDVPHAQTSATAPAVDCCGEDWGWFDAGGVRFISYPEPYTSSTWQAWQADADAVFANAQADASIHFIVTYGHRPAYSTGHHPGDAKLAGILDTFGDRYSKYVLNLNGHSHDYERFQPIHGVTHITSGGGGATLETPWTSTDARTAFRAMHLEHLRIDASDSGMRVEAVCGPATSNDDTACVPGSVIDSYTIGTTPASPPPAALDHIVVSPANATVAAGGSQAFTAEAFDASGGSLGDVTASTVFSIGPDGSCSGNVCTAKVTGVHTVTGDDSGKTGAASLTVTAGPIDRLVLSPASATIVAAGSQAYTAQGVDQYDNSLGDVTALASFSIVPDGSCTASACTASVPGEHTVTASLDGKSGTASLQVNAAVDHIVISPASATIGAGDSQAFTAEAFDASGGSLGDVTASTVFSIGPDGSCSANVCTAKVTGVHTVTGDDSGKTGAASLTVTAGPIDHLALSPASASIPMGGSQAYTAEARDAYDNSLGDVTALASFSIVPDGSCTASACTGSVPGDHTVTASLTGASGSASLQVKEPLDHIALSPGSTIVALGDSQSFTAEAFDASGNSLGDVTASTVFSIGPDGSCSGNVCTAMVGGPHTVTGNDSGKTGTATLSVSFVRNPDFETDTAGWNTSVTGVELARAAGGHTGDWAARLTNSGSSNAFCRLNDSANWVKPASAGTYTGTIWVRADTPRTLTLRLREFSLSNGDLVGSATSDVTLTTEWQLVTVTYQVATAATTLDFNAYIASAPPGTCFYADDATILRS